MDFIDLWTKFTSWDLRTRAVHHSFLITISVYRTAGSLVKVPSWSGFYDGVAVKFSLRIAQ